MTPIPQSAPTPLAHLIVVTPYPRLALYTQRVLLATGHAVEVAGTLRRGLAILQHRPPDGVVLDGEARDRHPADYDALVAAVHKAQVALIVLREPAVEPARLAVGTGEPVSAASPSPFAANLVEQLRTQGLSAEAASGQATYAGGW